MVLKSQTQASSWALERSNGLGLEREVVEPGVHTCQGYSSMPRPLDSTGVPMAGLVLQPDPGIVAIGTMLVLTTHAVPSQRAEYTEGYKSRSQGACYPF